MSHSAQIILGINCGHDASACLMLDGQIRVAVAEERLSRVKYHEGFPHRAIDYCLRAAESKEINEVDCIVMNQYAKSAYEMELQYRGYTNQLIINPSHHLLHAYYAYFASGFEDAAVLIVDGSGYHYGEYLVRNSPFLGPPPELSEMDEADTLFSIHKGNITLVEKRWGLWHSSEPYYRFPSLGHMFSVASKYIFGEWVHAGKTMGLAPYGNSDAMPFRIVTQTEKGLAIDVDWILKLPKPSYDLPVHEVKLKCDLAAKVQSELEEGMSYLVRRAHELTKLPNLCLSGGVALNSVANGRIVREGVFKNYFITPAASDAGVSIGAALYGYHFLNRTAPTISYPNDFHGRSYDEKVILGLIQNNPCIAYERVENPAQRAAEDVASGKIVGWFEGKGEFGPRALGHRSILCDPRQADMKNQLNNRVKFREIFRPFAASVLEEYASEYFDMNYKDPFMLVVASVYPAKRSIIPAVCHIDGTCRIQTVSVNFEGNYRKIIEHFYTLTSVPLILNTSFNLRGEPIVETPSDAIACFLSSGIDKLFLGQYLLRKLTLNETLRDDYLPYLIPRLNDQLKLRIESQPKDGRWEKYRTAIITRTGYRLSLAGYLFDLLELIDGESTAEVLLRRYNLDNKEQLQAKDMLTYLRNLQQQGLISFVWTDVLPR